MAGLRASLGLSLAAVVVAAIGVGPPVGPLVVVPFFLVVPALAAARLVPPAPAVVGAGLAVAVGLAGVVLIAETLLLTGLFSGLAVVLVVAVVGIAAAAR